MAKKKTVSKKVPTPYDKFKELARKVVSAPKDEVDRLADDIKKAKMKRKRA